MDQRELRLTAGMGLGRGSGEPSGRLESKASALDSKSAAPAATRIEAGVWLASALIAAYHFGSVCRPPDGDGAPLSASFVVLDDDARYQYFHR